MPMENEELVDVEESYPFCRGSPQGVRVGGLLWRDAHDIRPIPETNPCVLPCNATDNLSGAIRAPIVVDGDAIESDHPLVGDPFANGGFLVLGDGADFGLRASFIFASRTARMRRGRGHPHLTSTLSIVIPYLILSIRTVCVPGWRRR